MDFQSKEGEQEIHIRNDLCCHCSQARVSLGLLIPFLDNYEINSKKTTKVFVLTTQNAV